jgi:hypothetical protein
LHNRSLKARIIRRNDRISYAVETPEYFRRLKFNHASEAVRAAF